jgi:hypothetical protein
MLEQPQNRTSARASQRLLARRPFFHHLSPLAHQRPTPSLAKQNRIPPQAHGNHHQQPISIASFLPGFRRAIPAAAPRKLPRTCCIPVHACASIRLSAGSCAQPPGGGAVMMFASPHISNGKSVPSPYEMPIPIHPRVKSRAPSAFPFSDLAFPFPAFNSSEVKNEKLQH